MKRKEFTGKLSYYERGETLAGKTATVSGEEIAK